jgi:hypothetical protein
MRGVAITVIAILLVAIAVYFATQPGVTEITSMKTVYLQANQTSYFGLPDGVVAMRLQGYSGNGTTLYASQSPVLFGPVSLISLAAGASANVSGGGSSVADMNIRLVSGSASGVTLVITPLPVSLGVRASGGASVMNPTAFGTSGTSSASGTPASNTPASKSGSAVTSTVVSTATTTAQSASGSLQQAALTAANGTAIGKIMLGFKALYKLDAKCDPNTYNITYVAYYSAMPTGPNSFYNISAYAPTNLAASATALSASSYKVTYSTTSPVSVTTGPALTLLVNTTTFAVTSPAFMGIFQGFNSTKISQLYAFQNGIPNGNPCAALIAPP